MTRGRRTPTGGESRVARHETRGHCIDRNDLVSRRFGQFYDAATRLNSAAPNISPPSMTIELPVV